MDTAATKAYPQVLLTGPGPKAHVPTWIRGRFSPKIATARQIRRLPRLPQLTVVRASEPETVLAESGFLSLLAERLFDQLTLWVYPVVLGSGKKVFADGATPANLSLITPALTSPKGAVLLRYALAPGTPGTGDMSDADRAG